MEKSIKISTSPWDDGIGNAFEISLEVWQPRSDNEVTVLVNPSKDEHVEKEDLGPIKIRQKTVSSITEDTQNLFFSLPNDSVKQITIQNNNYEIRLLQIGKVKKTGQEWPYYDFLISQK